MADANTFTFSGRLGQAMQVEYFASGDPVGRFSVANNLFVGRDKDTGQIKEATTWIDCQWVSRGAEAIQHRMVKGREVLVTGRLRSYLTGTMTAPKYYVDVLEVHLLGHEASPGAREPFRAVPKAGTSNNGEEQRRPASSVPRSSHPAVPPDRAVPGPKGPKGDAPDDDDWAFQQ